MTTHVALFIILLAACCFAQDKPRLIGEIEFFGAAGSDVNKIKAALPFREGDEFNPETMPERLARVAEAVKQVHGRPPTDVTATCCDRGGNFIVFIGLSGKTVRHNARPVGAVRLPLNVVALYERNAQAVSEAVLKGVAGEDDSKGYALAEYLPLRATQLEMRAYALRYDALLRRVLRTAADDRQRAVAAQLLGYAQQSRPQMAALAHASRDADETVRNNATRALSVLAASDSRLAQDLPAEGFVELLLSGTWTDLNKASSLLSSITSKRSPRLFARLRQAEVLERLIETARWRTGHETAARMILGRLAGIDEQRLAQLVAAGEVQDILDALQSAGRTQAPR